MEMCPRCFSVSVPLKQNVWDTLLPRTDDTNWVFLNFFTRRQSPMCNWNHWTTVVQPLKLNFGSDEHFIIDFDLFLVYRCWQNKPDRTIHIKTILKRRGSDDWGIISHCKTSDRRNKSKIAGMGHGRPRTFQVRSWRFTSFGWKISCT